MDTDKNMTNDQNIQGISNDLNTLLNETREIIREEEKENKETREHMNAIEKEVDETIAAIDIACTELDQIEKEAGDELDALMLAEAEDLVVEDSADE
ncbi:MAG: hypothetical protein ABSB00_03645 [Minisyncoccia bacterium]|jgi:DNA repair ATPase RecN